MKLRTTAMEVLPRPRFGGEVVIKGRASSAKGLNALALHAHLSAAATSRPSA
jgi:hypothetical protein